MNTEKQDYLTGLLNRQGLYEWYEGVLGESVLQFMFMDLDNFKSVNDTYGHNVGDDLLKAVAAIFKSCQEDAICARLGGDEFVLVVPRKCDRDRMEQMAKDIIERIQNKQGFESISTDVSASIGILLDESSQESLNDILFKIDTAMYQAKIKGKSCYVIFNDIADIVYDEVDMERRQKQALQRNEFEVCYYPIISAQTSKLFISEVCLMWNQPDGRRRYPWEFMPVFEKNGFVCVMDIWTIKQVCGHLKKYYEETGMHGRIAIPVSKLLLFRQNLVQTLLEILQNYGVEPKELVFEVAEGDFSRGSMEIVQRLKELKTAGFGISIIEVGVSFASLCYWDKIEFDYIRLHDEYLKGVLHTYKGRQVVKTLLSMGRDLRIKVIADGIESKEDMLFLSGCGCNAISGSLYSLSLPVNEYREYVWKRIQQKERKIAFPFLGNLQSQDGKFEGRMIGNGITFEAGISKKWGGIRLHGAVAGNNIVELPAKILTTESYTIGIWLKPSCLKCWTSAVYARYLGGFLSYVPYAGGGQSIFRISEDMDANGFHDVLGRQLQEDKWFFVCLTFEAESGVLRYYINGRKIGYQKDVPLLPSCKQILLGGDPFQASYEGVVSGLFFYDNVKSEEDVEELYKEFLQDEGFAGETEDFWFGAEQAQGGQSPNI